MWIVWKKMVKFIGGLLIIARFAFQRMAIDKVEMSICYFEWHYKKIKKWSINKFKYCTSLFNKFSMTFVSW